MTVTEDERFMTRALELAAGAGFTSPNPKVGTVVVRDGQILGEGAHEGAGTAHAEAIALDGVDARSATIYVNLEPCAHHGRMPPCAPMLIEAGVKRVVVAIEDPDKRVAGAGIALLREAGVQVEVGICDHEARALNRSYLHHRKTGLPFVTLKLAVSLDGKLAAADGSSRWITGPVARRRVHRMRAASDAVLIGAGTVIADDPRLTARTATAVRQPSRVICDATGRTPAEARVFEAPGTIVMTTDACTHEAPTAWKEAGAEVVIVPGSSEGGVDLRAVLGDLGRRGWLDVLCEGGPSLATSLVRAGLVDRLDLNVGPVLLGGTGLGLGDLGIETMTEAIRWTTVGLMRVGDDSVITLERSN